MHGETKKWMHGAIVARSSDGSGGSLMQLPAADGDNEDMWFVVLIVFATMFLIQAAQFAWIVYLLRRIDVLEDGGPQAVADAPLVDDPAGKPRRRQLAAHA